MVRKWAVILCALLVWSFSTNLKARIIGYEFLRTHVGARPSALGGAFLTIPGDVHAVYYNPAGLVTLPEKQLTFSYLNHFLDFQSGFIAYGFHRPGIGYLGLGAHYMNYGEFVRSDDLGNEQGTFTAGNLVVTGDYAAKFSDEFSVGVAVKFIHSKIAEYTSSALAADFGFLYLFPRQNLQVGFGVFNVGKVTSTFVQSKDDLPMNYRIGVSKRLAHLPLLLSVEGYQYLEEDFQFIVAGEFTVTPFLFLRLSYNSVGRQQKGGPNGDKYAGVSIGTGVSLENASRFQHTFWKNFSFDYSFTSAGNVGSLNRFSLTLHFGSRSPSS